MGQHQRRLLALSHARALEVAAMNAPPPPPPAPVDPRNTDPLYGVEFASKAARDYAEENGMTWKTFASSMLTMSARKGYTKKDVAGILLEIEDDSTG